MGKTTRELIDEFIDIENDLEVVADGYDDANEAEVEALSNKLVVVKNEMQKKVDNIDRFSLELTRTENLLEAEVKTLRHEMKRLNNKRRAIKKTKEFFNQQLLPVVIETMGNNGIFRTDTARYSMHDAWGPLEITDEEAIPDKYRRYKIEVDKASARPDVIAAAEKDMGISGFEINKVKRVRRT